MRVEKFKSEIKSKLSELMMSKVGLSYNQSMKIISKKDAKINGQRVSKDQSVNEGDEIVFYYDEKLVKETIDIIYEDDNIVIVFKPRQIEVVSESDIDLETKLSQKLKTDCYAVHRLDRNTIGLVVFAKNLEAKTILDEGFKNRTIDKNYLALVYGSVKASDDMVSYLKKDKEKSIVFISDEKKQGYEKIETKYSLVKSFDNFSLVDVELVTGKTHQIRAHFAHIGSPILGDEKYGYTDFNREYKLKYQCLCAYKIRFHFKNNLLSYLDNKEFVLDDSKIDFLKLCK